MCGIFSLLFQNNEIEHSKIEKSFKKGSSRGPEFSHLELINGTRQQNNYNTNIYFGFHRLAINGLDEISNQPFHLENISLVCNGEIYNYKELFALLDITPRTNSDCEIILHMYKKYGIEYTLQILDGVFAFILYDHENNLLISARDPYGVRPLYMLQYQQNVHQSMIYGFASEMKTLIDFVNPNTEAMYPQIQQFHPGTYTIIKQDILSNWKVSSLYTKYTHPGFGNIHPLVDLNEAIREDDFEVYETLRFHLENAIDKRVQTTERPIACLLSGGLDSSLICSLVAKKVLKEQGKQIETYSIGLEGSDDLHYAKLVASFLKTNHHEVVVTEQEFLDAIPEVIYKIESYDTTTIRASVGNYLVSKYISENSEAKVIFNGDGADELMGGYLYFHKAPNPLEFDKECRRLLNDIYMYDVLRSDKTISSCGLEPRTPFLDRSFVQYYLSLTPMLRCQNIYGVCEKYLIRKAYANQDVLPDKILWRTKEAFSDGVSKQTRSWYKIIQEHVSKIVELPQITEISNTESLNQNSDSNSNSNSDSDSDSNSNSNYSTILYKDIPIFTSNNKFGFNTPTSPEQLFYRSIFEHFYPNCGKLLPYFWMPKYVDATDSSARTLDLYKVKMHKRTLSVEKNMNAI